MKTPGKLRKDADPAALTTATMASIHGGLLVTQVRRDPRQLRIALNAARANLRLAAADHGRERSRYARRQPRRRGSEGEGRRHQPSWRCARKCARKS
jgi:hypothetical protein